jgi:uncharacterized protein
MRNCVSRREFIKSAALVGLAGRSVASIAAAETPQRRALQPFEEFEFGDVRLTGGPLKEQYDRLRAFYLALDNDRLLKVYRTRAGLPAPGANMGGWYDADGFVPGHALGQYISGLARMGRATGDPQCNAKIAALVAGFAETLGAKNRIFAGPNAENVWPCYVLDKHLAGLIDAFQLAGVAQARELIGRVYAGALPYIPVQGRDRIGKTNPPYDETYVLPENLFTASVLTGDRALFDRARAYLLDADFFDPLARGQDVLPGRHAYSHAIALSSAGKAHLVLGDEKYIGAMKNAWDLLTTTQQFATGGWGPNETFITPHRGELYESLRSTVDHFETPCGSYAAIKLARSLLCATGDSRYGDNLERVLYNTILGAKDPDSDGDCFYYSTYSSDAHKTYYGKRWPCCSGTLIQCVADYVKDIYFETADGVAVNLYVPSELEWNANGRSVHLAQETDYPVGERVTLRVQCPQPTEFTLRLRVPAWLQGPPSVRVNGMPANMNMHRGFAALRRTWRSGDVVTLNLNQSFRTEAIDDLHPRTVALLRGPVVYVEINPRSGTNALAPLGAMRTAGSDGAFSVRDHGEERSFAPFYSVRDASYSTYFQI